MAHVNQESFSSALTVMEDGNPGLIGGLFAKAVIFTDPSGSARAIHSEVERLQPWLREILHQSVRAWPSPLREQVLHILGGGPAVEGVEVVVPLSPAVSEPFHASVVPARDASGRVAGVVVTLYDLTPTQAVSKNLGQLIRLASIGTISAGLAHEIKNAMVAVNTFVDILVNKHGDTELAPIVSREIRRMDHIVAQMLRVSRPARAELQPVSVHELIDHALAVARHRIAGGGIDLVRNLRADPDVVMGESGQLEQAFVNLLYNAIDSMGANGTLTVSTRRLGGADGARGTEAAPWVRLVISDTGCGIAEADLPRLFEPFFTTKPTGHGLGLAVTKRIVVEHGGAIDVASRSGKGTAVTVDLPASTRQP